MPAVSSLVNKAGHTHACTHTYIYYCLVLVEKCMIKSLEAYPRVIVTGWWTYCPQVVGFGVIFTLFFIFSVPNIFVAKHIYVYLVYGDKTSTAVLTFRIYWSTSP